MQDYLIHVEIFIALLAAAAIGLWIAYRGRKTEEFIPEESLFDVKAEGTQITCIRPNGSVESFDWAKLVKVDILTTEDGPLLPDVFWVFYDSENSGAVIPQGAPGLAPLTEKTMSLPGFDSESLIEAMSSTAHGTFPVWKK